MGKANKFVVIALSAVMLLIGSMSTGIVRNTEHMSSKPDFLYDLAVYDLCDDARTMLKESLVLYAGSPFALINGAPGRVRANNPEAVPIIENNEVYVPAAFIAEALGARPSWHTDTTAMVIKSRNNSISFITGQNKISLNGTQVFLPYPTFFRYGEAYIHLSSFCEVFGRNVCCFGNIIMVNPIGRVVDLNEDRHIVNDLMLYFSGGKVSPKNAVLGESAAAVNTNQPAKGRDIRVYLNEDELNLYAFPITEIDPDASAHDHSLILQDNVVMAPVVLLRLLDVEVFESVKHDAISMLEAAPFGNYVSLTLKPGTDHAYLNLHGEDPYKDEEAFKDRLVVLPAAPRLLSNHLYIPVVEVSRLFGVRADWDPKNYSVRIRSMGSPRFPNLRWAPLIIRNMETDYKLTMTIHTKGSDGKDLRRVDYVSSGHYASGEYCGQAAVATATGGSALFDSEALYEVKRYLNKDYEYEYSARDLRNQTSEARPVDTLRCREILMTDIEYLRRKAELLTSHFYASDLLKKQPDVSIGVRTVDKYSIELNDMPSITELFGIRKPPEIDSRKSKTTNAKDCVLEYLRMELSVDKEGQITNCSIHYKGHIKKERQITSPEFEVFINADFF